MNDAFFCGFNASFLLYLNSSNVLFRCIILFPTGLFEAIDSGIIGKDTFRAFP